MLFRWNCIKKPLPIRFLRTEAAEDYWNKKVNLLYIDKSYLCKVCENAFYLSKLSYYWSWDGFMWDKSEGTEEQTVLGLKATSRRKWLFFPQQTSVLVEEKTFPGQPEIYLACSSSTVWILSKRLRGWIKLSNLPAFMLLNLLLLLVFANTCLSIIPFSHSLLST